jgi:hypothetical protein
LYFKHFLCVVGGTVDVTVYEVLDDGDMKELNQATGGAWGGTTVDGAYIRLITEMVGEQVMQEWPAERMEDWLEFQRDFVVKKRGIDKGTTDKITLPFPVSLTEKCKSVRRSKPADLVTKSKTYAGKIEFRPAKLRLHPDLARSLFTKTIDSIVHHVQTLLQDPVVETISTILMVGGLSEAPLVKDAIRTRVPQKTVICPGEAGLAVLKGAVIYGHRPGVIRARVARHTYGIGVSVQFDESIHPADKKYTRVGQERCSDIFKEFVQQGQTIHVDNPDVTLRLGPTTQAELATFHLFASTSASPHYVTDPGCSLLGKMVLDVTDTVGRKRKLTVKMSFGDTEIHASAVEDDTGKSVDTVVDFLG